MSLRSQSSGVRRPQEVIGIETGLPLVPCPYCGKARVVERRSQKENNNKGCVYFKCPRGYGWRPDKCDYYRWQRGYFTDLVKANVIKVADLYLEEVVDRVRDDEFENEEQDETRGMNLMSMENMSMEKEVVDVKMQKDEVAAQLDKLMKLVFVLFVLCVGITAMFFGYVLK